MIILTKEQVLMLHDRLIEVTGGSEGIRDDGKFGCLFEEENFATRCRKAAGR